MSYRIGFIGAGSPGFSFGVAKEIVETESLRDGTFVLMDIDAGKLRLSEQRIRALVKEKQSPLRVEATLNRKACLKGCDFVVTSCEKKRVTNWIRDIEIAERFGVHQLSGENGGPGGQIHAMRNITMFKGITDDMAELCPKAWLLNFTNPMSFICTFLLKHSPIRSVGLCHQVHGSFGAEMLGFDPGELQVITGGINHMNWLVDIRRKGTDQSCLTEFMERVRQNKYWHKNRENIPEQRFTLDFLETFGVYPVGYDNHIVEYMPFFYPREEWKKHGYQSRKVNLKQYLHKGADKTPKSHLEQLELSMSRYPFPKNPGHPYYFEKACTVADALARNEPTYLDAINIINHGAVDNLPDDAVVDIPALVVGGEVRGVHVGKLPAIGAELCRRQITIHELVAEATLTGDRQQALQAMALDPYVHTLSQARGILDAYLKYYREDLPQFWK